jgi:tRNA (guanine37-N1)-methyltransferase
LAAVKIITLFPEFFGSPLSTGLLGKAIEAGLLRVDVVDLRDFAENRYRQCDDYPYGGGSGMVLMPGPLFRAIASVRGEGTRVLLTSASGTLLTQQMVKRLAGEKELCIVCGHYEGVDQRVVERFVDYEVSVGDYVLSGGEFAALAIVDAVARYIPGFMSNSESLVEESFEDGLLEYPQYTRPAEIEGLAVPDVLLSGDHARIRNWRHEQRIERTGRVRPDLYKRYCESKDKGEDR